MATMGTWRDGKVVLDDDPHWKEGARLKIEAAELDDTDDPNGLLGDDPESIKRWLAEFDALPALAMSPEEEARWNAERQVMKQYSIKKMLERSEQWP